MKLAATLAALLFTLLLNAQPGSPDSSFGTNGKVVENLSAPYTNALDAVLQTDGKTIVLAEAEYNQMNRVVLIRYTTSGTLDASFNNDGIADSLVSAGVDVFPTAIKLQADGKILVCGYTSDYPDHAFVYRYNTNGSLDNTFAAGGVYYSPDQDINAITSLAVLSGGKIMLLSYSAVANADLVLTRLNNNGTPDNSFGSNGIVALDALNTSYPEYTKLEVQADGKLIVGGNPNDFQATNYSLVLIRVNANGTIDNTYGIGGNILLDAGSAFYNKLTDMAIQTDGKIVVSGTGENNLFEYNYIIRVNTSGALDAGFGTGGKQYLRFNLTGFANPVGQLSLQSDNKILVGGMMKNAFGNYTMAVARLTTAGIPDNGFGTNGFAALNVNQESSYGFVPLQQSDGKILLTGYARRNTIYSVAIGRLTAAGVADNTINTTNSVAFFGSGIDDDGSLDMHLQPDQKIINMRWRGNGLAYDLAVSRHLPSGLPDNTFGTAGKLIIDLPGDIYTAYSGLLANGKLMIAAQVTDFITGGKLMMIRVNTNGTPDSSFGQYGKLLLPAATNHTSSLIKAAFQPDGKAMLLYYQDTNGSYMDSVFLARLDASGSFDNSFNSTGKKLLPYTGGIYKGAFLQSDNKILLTYNGYVNNNYNPFISRYTSGGATDNTFDSGNPVTLPFDVTVATQQPDGRIILASDYGTSISRLNINGSFDNTLDTAGTAHLTSYFPALSNIIDVEAATDTTILVVGNALDTLSYSYMPMLMRLKANGRPDSSFSADGSAMVTGLSDSNAYNSAIVEQADHKILIAGYIDSAITQTSYFPGSFGMVRLKGGNLATGRLYMFTGSGNWSNPANWSGGMLPPATLPAGSSIMIDPPAGGECVLDITQHIATGATFTVKAGKKLRIPMNLILQ